MKLSFTGSISSKIYVQLQKLAHIFQTVHVVVVVFFFCCPGHRHMHVNLPGFWCWKCADVMRATKQVSNTGKLWSALVNQAYNTPAPPSHTQLTYLVPLSVALWVCSHFYKEAPWETKDLPWLVPPEQLMTGFIMISPDSLLIIFVQPLFSSAHNNNWCIISSPKFPLLFQLLDGLVFFSTEWWNVECVLVAGLNASDRQ